MMSRTVHSVHGVLSSSCSGRVSAMTLRADARPRSNRSIVSDIDALLDAHSDPRSDARVGQRAARTPAGLERRPGQGGPVLARLRVALRRDQLVDAPRGRVDLRAGEQLTQRDTDLTVEVLAQPL